MYNFVHWKMYNYNELFNKEAIENKYNFKDKTTTRFSKYIIMVDTETSKSKKDSFTYEKKGKRTIKKWNSEKNYIVAFSISIRYEHENIVTLWGNKPDECVTCIQELLKHIYGDKVLMFVFNLPFDWVFLRKFLIDKLGEPEHQLNIDPHYPISIEFSKLILRDALVLAQRKLEKWANDLNVEHKKLVNDEWDYSKIRTQNEHYSSSELAYIEHDTLAGVECLDALLTTLNCKLKDIPYTATGISRRMAYRIGKKNKAKLLFNKLALSYEDYLKFVQGFHGGYTHTNRFFANKLCRGVTCYDESSAYPTVVCSEKFPMSPFIHLNGYYTVDEILSTHDKYAYFFKATFINVRLRDEHIQMPVLQVDKDLTKISKDDMSIDNGRLLSSPVFECYLNDIDLELVNQQYKADYIIITDVMRSKYDYLPRWFTEHVYQIYSDKCRLKGGDPVLYDITKMRLNSVAYGMLAMRNVKEILVEDYESGKYEIEPNDPRELYEKYINNRKSIYPYQWALWVTSYAMRNLHNLGACCKTWMYSDTDSCFSNDWDLDKIEQYNNDVTERLKKNGFEPVDVNGKIYYLGRAELDKTCDEFKALHSKCYAYKSHDEIFITVAGVPKKKGKKCIKNIDKDFKEGFLFDGLITGKLTHVYHFIESITYENGILYGDSIDLVPCDYYIQNARIDNIVDNYDDIPDIVSHLFNDSVYERCKNYD